MGGIAFGIAARVLGLRDMGMCISPFNSFLISMGLETLPLRMQKHCDNALAVAKFLKTHDKISWVIYAGLDGDSSNALHKKYCPQGAGSLFTFGLKGGYDAGKKLVNSVKMISLVANLGDTRTLIAHPASMMHSQLTEEQQRAAILPFCAFPSGLRTCMISSLIFPKPSSWLSPVAKCELPIEAGLATKLGGHF